MKTETRIYLVTVADHGRHLVRAVNQAAALKHVMRSIATVGVASQDELVRCVSDGIKVETAGETAGEATEQG